jgi:diguanylate cyclase
MTSNLLLFALAGPLVALVISAALMVISAAVTKEASAPGALRSHNLGLTANTLLAAGIWWAGYQGAESNNNDALPALALLAVLSWLTAYSARYGAGRPWRHSKQRRGMIGTLVASTLCVALLNSLPGSGLAWPAVVLLGMSLPLAVALRALHVREQQTPHAPALRLVGAGMAAVSLMAVAYRSPAQEAVSFAPALLPSAALVALGLLLLTNLRQTRRQRTQSHDTGAHLGIDTLTGLPNRAALEAALAKAAMVCDRDRLHLALLTVNLDGFKPVNATYGHAVGDQLLRQAGTRIKRLLRPADKLARIGGDEFVILLTDQAQGDALAALADRIVDNMARAFRVGTREVTLSCSLGVAIYPDHGESEKLLARSDAAMLAAKRAGGNRVSHYHAEMEGDLVENLDLLRDFRHALDHNQLKLFYQPKIDAASGKITAAEALLRWRHPVRGDVPPTVFVALAERFGLVGRLGDWVIETACRQARIWADRGLHMRVAINLSAQHMHQPDVAARIQQALARHGIDPARLTCEITESLAMENTQATQATFAQLGAAGIHLSIDDFGTGYSSLAYLRKLPASEIKVDRSFVLDIEHSSDARAVVDAVVKLAHALGKKVVAEGVENVRQRRILTDMGCDELQGFLFAYPMSGSQLLKWAFDDGEQGENAFRESLFASPTDFERDPLEDLLADRSEHVH